MEFKKYNSIENHYRQKFIDKMIYHNPEALEDTWIAREKLDGANIQLVFTPNQEMRVGKRSSYLSKEDSFFDIWNTLEKYKKELSNIQDYVNRYDDPIRLFGEIYGPGINGRVDYGPEKKIAIYDMMNVDDERMEAQCLFELFTMAVQIEHLLPKKLAEGKLLDVLQVDVETGNTEGVVIKPWKTSYYLNDERFIIKKKTQAFLDKERNEGEPARENTSDIAYSINKEFTKYLNDNRVLDVFAKHGPMTEMKQIGTYIKLVTEDAKEDFLKDHDLATLIPGMTQKQEKMVYNSGGIIAGLLKKYL